MIYIFHLGVGQSNEDSVYKKIRKNVLKKKRKTKKNKINRPSKSGNRQRREKKTPNLSLRLYFVTFTFSYISHIYVSAHFLCRRRAALNSIKTSTTAAAAHFPFLFLRCSTLFLSLYACV